MTYWLYYWTSLETIAPTGVLACKAEGDEFPLEDCLVDLVAKYGEVKGITHWHRISLTQYMGFCNFCKRHGYGDHGDRIEKKPFKLIKKDDETEH